jgi:hypothetical protein
MLARMLVFFALSASVSAGVIVQTGSLDDNDESLVQPFQADGRLTAVKATFQVFVDWTLFYYFDGDPGVPLDPPATITSVAATSVELGLPGGGWGGTPDTPCEALITETEFVGEVSCAGGISEFDWIGDPNDPAWSGPDPLSVGFAILSVSEMECQPGSPAIPCFVDLGGRQPSGSAEYTLTYYYIDAADIPEPSPAALILFPLAVGALAIRPRVRRP